MSKNWIGTRFDSLEHMVGETLEFNMDTPYFFKDFSLISKVFHNIHQYGY